MTWNELHMTDLEWVKHYLETTDNWCREKYKILILMNFIM